jgi:Na+/H+-dicarboxylate symporter
MNSLIIKLILGIVTGVFIGLFAPMGVSLVVLTISNLLGQFIGFMIPLIIIFFITHGIASLKGNAGRILGGTIGLAYGSTLCAGFLAYLIAHLLLPLFVNGTIEGIREGAELTPLLSIEVAPITNVMTALVFALTFGIGMTVIKSVYMDNLFEEGKKVVELILKKVLIPLLPVYIAGVFVEVTLQGTLFSTLKTFGLVLALAICIHWLWLFILYAATGVITSRNPMKALRTMLPAYVTAIATMSSAATIPVTLKQVQENGVSKPVASFTVPLFATLHLSGSTITIVTCAIAVMILNHQLELIQLGTMLPFICMLGLIMIAAPGVPGGAVMSALGILASMLGFDNTAIGLMIALYLAQDSFGTATNVTGDGALALLVDRFAKVPVMYDEKKPELTPETLI